jgi:hypothetical protein
VKFHVPVLFWLLYSLFPFSLINSNRSLPIYFGNGQVMMFTQNVYRAIGGHRAIRDNVFDDISLHGFRSQSSPCAFVSHSPWCSCIRSPSPCSLSRPWARSF